MDIRPSAACGGLCNGRAGSTSARGFDVFALGPTDQRARARIHDSPRSPRPFLVRPDAAGLPRGVVRMGDRHLRRRVDLAPDARKLNVGARSCRRNPIHTVRGMLSLGTTPYPQEESALRPSWIGPWRAVSCAARMLYTSLWLALSGPSKYCSRRSCRMDYPDIARRRHNVGRP